MLNTQPIEKHSSSNGNFLDVVEVFYTIQGEGPHTGDRAVFVRLAGCNLKCPSCDTDYTSNRVTSKIEVLVNQVIKLQPSPCLVVITGGEPFRQNITPFINMLISFGYWVQIETNGSLAPSPQLDDSVIVVCSPKTGKVNPQIEKRADCYKYVMGCESVDPEDGLPVLALNHKCRPRVARPPEGMHVYLQPLDSKNIAQNHKHVAAVVESCKKYGHTLQLQIQKIIGVD